MSMSHNAETAIIFIQYPMMKKKCFHSVLLYVGLDKRQNLEQLSPKPKGAPKATHCQIPFTMFSFSCLALSRRVNIVVI